MKKIIIILLTLACTNSVWAAPAAPAAPAIWFTVTGDPQDPTVNTIEVDPTPVAANGDMRAMQVRVSRAQSRTSWDGVPYRSYVSTVLFDCADKSAKYVTLAFYLQPLWKGESHKTVTYNNDVVRPMAFRDVTPNPTERIIRAACETGKVTNN
ncbi:MAG: surface-adhesin E family protein [Polaromonas sp.]|uniref:surface-adhesin E family protein n=1 Tax=Polaromonas sp. TaxID=1869339 RepID=UPI0032661A80